MKITHEILETLAAEGKKLIDAGYELINVYVGTKGPTLQIHTRTKQWPEGGARSEHTDGRHTHVYIDRGDHTITWVEHATEAAA